MQISIKEFEHNLGYIYVELRTKKHGIPPGKNGVIDNNNAYKESVDLRADAIL